jgi:hypothetical protein
MLGLADGSVVDANGDAIPMHLGDRKAAVGVADRVEMIAKRAHGHHGDVLISRG